MVKREPPRDPGDKPGRIDWRRIAEGDAPQAPSRRAPFRFGREDEPVEGADESGRDPWKELLERGSMQEVLASVRRVSGLPDEPDPPPAQKPDPPPREPHPPRARSDVGRPAAPAPRSERPVERVAPQQPPAEPRRTDARPPAGSPIEKPAPRWRAGPPASPPRIVTGTRSDRQEQAPAARSGGGRAGAAPGPAQGPPPPPERPPQASRANPVERVERPPMTAPRRMPPAPPTDAETERRSPAPERRPAPRGDVKPTLVLSEMADRDGTDDTAGTAPPQGFAPNLVPRRSALHEARKRREVGPLAVIAVLAMALGIGVAFGLGVDAGSWSLPWRSAEQDVAQPPVPAEPVDGTVRVPSEPSPVAAGPAPGPNAARGTAAAGERPIPVPVLRPDDDPLAGAMGGAEILIEDIGGNRAGGPLPDAAPASGDGATFGGEEVAASDIGRTDVDRLAPLFLGRIYVHYGESPDDPARRGRALDIARRLEESGYRIGGVRPVNFPVTGSSVRYFFESDAPVAARLQEDLPASIAEQTRLMDFTAYEPRPRPGTIELWVADPS